MVMKLHRLRAGATWRLHARLGATASRAARCAVGSKHARRALLCVTFFLVLLTMLLNIAYAGAALSHRMVYSTVLTAQPFAYATFYGDDELLPALRVFLRSLSDTQPQFPLLIGASPRVDLQSLLSAARSYEHSVAVEVWTPPRVWGEDAAAVARAADWSRLRLWQLRRFRRVLYAAPDVVFLRNVDGVFARDTGSALCVAAQQQGLAHAASGDEGDVDDSVLLLQPSLRSYARLRLAGAADASAYSLHTLLRRQRPSCSLPWTMNAAAELLAVAAPGGWNASQAQLLHFTGEKPWRSWSTRKYREAWVPDERVRAMSRAGRWDADAAHEAHGLWKALFMRDKQPEAHLQLWQMYHQRACWPHLETGALFSHIRLAGPMRAPQDLDAAVLEPRFADTATQAALAEFAGMLALSCARSLLLARPFVGFTSWRWHEKEHWREGASLDWTKVDFDDARAVFFWYAIHMQPTFYDGIDVQHPGMAAVMRAVFPGEGELPLLGAGHYAMSNYVIMHVSLFDSFMEFARAALERYLALFPVDGPCPFETKRSERERCAAFFTERLLHVWAARNGVRMVYAVDRPEWRVPYGITAQ